MVLHPVIEKPLKGFGTGRSEALGVGLGGWIGAEDAVGVTPEFALAI